MSGSALNAVVAQGYNADPTKFIGNWVNLGRSQTELQQAQFNLQQSQLGPAYQAMRQLMATNPNPTADDITAALGGAARIGGRVDGVVRNFTDWTARGGTPADFVRAYALGGMSPERQGELVGPRQQGFTTAQGTYYGTMGGPWSATAGQFTPGGFIAQGLSPEQWATPAQVYDPQTKTWTMKPFGEAWGYPQPPGLGGTTGSGMPIMGTGGAAGASGGGPAAIGPGVGGASPQPSQAPPQPSGAPPGANIAPGAPLSQKDADLAAFAQRESGNQNIYSNVKVPGYTQQQLGSGYYQIIPSTWAEGQALAGIPPAQRTGTAIEASPQQQYAVASALYDKYGGRPWARSAPGGAGGGGGGGGGPVSAPFIGAATAQPAAAGGGAVRPAAAGGMQYFPAAPNVGGAPGGAPSGRSLPLLSPYEQPQLEQSAKDYVESMVTNRSLGQRIAPLQNAISIIQSNPGLVTGPSAENWYQWVQGIAAATGIDVGDVHNANAYQMLAKQLANNLIQSGADPTDMARLMREASQPNTTQGKQAIVTLAAEQIGYQRMKSAQYLEFRSRHPSDANSSAQFFNQETADWASQQDPIAYGADHIPQQELSKYYNSLDKAGKARFEASLVAAKRLFHFTLPIGGQNGG